MTTTLVKRALISVSDKTGLIPFAQQLVRQGVSIISTGGTSRALSEADIAHAQVEEVTDLPEMLGGRVKTLHPKIHGGILGKRDQQAVEAEQHGIEWIDLVVVNFYPFSDAVAAGADWDEAIEKIDIGGPTMVRAAAKNFQWVGVITDPLDYQQVIDELQANNGLGWEARKHFAQKAFELTCAYDAMISRYFSESADNAAHQDETGASRLLKLHKKASLRYGENPHQGAAVYQLSGAGQGVLSARQIQGKALSYNNMLDADAAYAAIQSFEQPACVIVKHGNPCGVAVAPTIEEAFHRAYQADSLSAFGGIVALNRVCTRPIADALTNVFMELVIASDFADDAGTVFAAKPNLRLLALGGQTHSLFEMRCIEGGVLLQERDTAFLQETDLQVVTHKAPAVEAVQDLLFAWQVVKHVKSNAICLAKAQQTTGIGAGQVSRVDAVDIAIKKAGEKLDGSVLASDAFFPFRDSIDRLAQTGITSIVQPGGSKRDEEVIAACNELGISMVFTGKRCFKH